MHPTRLKFSQLVRPFSSIQQSTQPPARQSINLKQAAYLQQFEGLPLSMIAKQTEPKYSLEQVKQKLASTKWPSSDQLLKFYETHRHVFIGKTNSGIFNQFLAALQLISKIEHKQRKKLSKPAPTGTTAQMQIVFNDLDQLLKKQPKAGVVELIEKTVYINNLHGAKRLPKHICQAFIQALSEPDKLSFIGCVQLINAIVAGQAAFGLDHEQVIKHLQVLEARVLGTYSDRLMSLSTTRIEHVVNSFASALL